MKFSLRLLLLGIAMMMFELSVRAGSITEEQARAKAQSFLQTRRPLLNGKRFAPTQTPTELRNVPTGKTALYVFNVGNNEGFVIVSSSDLVPHVLAYADRGTFDKESLPANMQSWLQGYADQIAYLERTEGKYEAPMLRVQRNAVNTLLNSTWHQDEPYNNKCPIDPSTGNRCVTGCMATAMAQVINYYKYPSQTKAVIPSYTTKEKQISMPEIGITAIDWNNMLDNYNSYATTAQKNAVAQLMLLCGQALKMDYDYPESSITSLDMPLEATALQRYFGYDQTVRALDRNAFSTNEWESLIYNEVAAGRPVLYNGVSSGGGHAFVVDGYDGNGLFHVNWGWNGKSDGYFALSILNPYNTSSIGASSSHDGYSFGQNVVVGIQHGTEEVIAERFMVDGIKNTGSSTYTRSSGSDDFTGIDIQPTVWNMTGDTHSFLLGLTLIDSDGEWLTEVFDNYIPIGNLGFQYGGSLNFENCTFGANLPDGVYYVIPVSGSENSNYWEPCWRSNVYRVKATISGNTLTLTEPSINLNATMQTASQNIVGESLHIAAQITNNGSYFNDYVYLLEDYITNRVGGRMFEAKEGQTASFDIDYVPLSSGSKTLALATWDSEAGNYSIFAYTTVNVAKHLNYTISIENAANGVVSDSKVNARVNITNNGSSFDNDVMLRLFTFDENDAPVFVDSQQKYLTLANGMTKGVDFEIENLERNQSYLLSFIYKKADWIDDGSYTSFTTIVPQLTLTASPSSGIINYMQEVTLTASNPNAEIYCTFDGSEPTKDDFLYDPPLQIDHSLTMKAKAFLDCYEDSETLAREYQVKLDIAADCASGTVRAGQMVTLSSSHPEATIYYTIDGTTPNSQSNVYTSPLSIDSTMTLNAVAMHEGCLQSNLLTRNYTVQVVTISISPSNRLISADTNISISVIPSDATIRYTVDGSEPSRSSELYTNPISLVQSTELKVLAYKDGYKDGTNEKSYVIFKGQGTMNYPYIVNNADELYAFAESVNSGNSYRGKRFKLVNDVIFNADLSNISPSNSTLKQWIPIGTESNPFEGIFDGDGHTIYGLYINNITQNNVGFFGYAGSSSTTCYIEEGILNLSIKKSYVYGNSNVGGIVGKAENIKIENCSNWAVVKSSNNNSGGICGYAMCTPIKSCYNRGDISGCYNVGGIIGYDYMRGAYDCANYGHITGQKDVGGIVGYLYAYIGGIYVYNSYNCGTITCPNYAGGISGHISYTTSSGLKGESRMRACVNYGKVEGTGTQCAGIVGWSSSNSYYYNCYYLTGMSSKLYGGIDKYNTTNYKVSSSCSAKSSEDMKSIDFINTLNSSIKTEGSNYSLWIFGKDGYPILEYIDEDETEEYVEQKYPTSGAYVVNADYSIEGGTGYMQEEWTVTLTKDDVENGKYWIEGMIPQSIIDWSNTRTTHEGVINPEDPIENAGGSANIGIATDKVYGYLQKDGNIVIPSHQYVRGYVNSYYTKNYSSDGDITLNISYEDNTMSITDAWGLTSVFDLIEGNEETEYVRFDNMTFRMKKEEESTLKGDVNGDNIVDREDAIAVANYILKKPSPSFNPTAADVNGDGIINITDAIAIENVIKQNK